MNPKNRKRPESRRIEPKTTFPIYVPTTMPEDALRFLNDLKSNGTFSIDIVQIVIQYLEARKFLEPNKTIKSVPDGKTLVSMFQKQFNIDQVTTANDASPSIDSISATKETITNDIPSQVDADTPVPEKEAPTIEKDPEPTAPELKVIPSVTEAESRHVVPAAKVEVATATEEPAHVFTEAPTGVGSKVSAQQILKNRRISTTSSLNQ